MLLRCFSNGTALVRGGIQRRHCTDLSRPLEGYRILDLSRILAGPFCTMMLGDMGADVIKVEHPVTGDDTRTWGPPYSLKGEQSAYFLGVNRNKRSIGIDLKTPEGLKLVYELAKHSDVVVENFVPGKAAELGVGYEQLCKVNPQLVYGSISGYGQTGPKANYLAYDVMISALGGLMGITGPKGGNPCKVGVAITDVCTGMVLHGAILAALLARHRTKKGQYVETSLLNTQIMSLANVASAYLVGGSVAQPQGTEHSSIVPYQAFVCKDGVSVIIGALNNIQWAKLVRALELHESLISDPRFVSNPQRVKNRIELLLILDAAVAKHDSKYWIEVLDAAKVPCAPINSIDKVFEDPQVIHNQRILSVEHPTVGMLKMVAPAANFYGTPLTKFTPPPILGQHTDEILTELLKIETATIAELRKAKVIN